MVTQRIVFALVIYLCVVVKEQSEPHPQDLLQAAAAGFGKIVVPSSDVAPAHPRSASVRARPARRKMVGVTGFEPVTLRLSSACSNQLSYTPNAGLQSRSGRPPADPNRNSAKLVELRRLELPTYSLQSYRSTN